MPAKFVSLSVFFPAYNDAPSLPALLGKTFQVLERHVADFEVIVVNDGSYDRTAKVLEELLSVHGPCMRVVTHATNRGYGGALRVCELVIANAHRIHQHACVDQRDHWMHVFRNARGRV